MDHTHETHMHQIVWGATKVQRVEIRVSAV